MNAQTTIAVCYKAGTEDMLKIWLRSVLAHTNDPVQIAVVVADEASKNEATGVIGTRGDVFPVTPSSSYPTRVHGAMLDAFLANNVVTTKFFLTMDSDCFPVADGWLSSLESMMELNTEIAGILHPWMPPPDDMDHHKIEWRIRSQHNWDRTHVACQMIRMEDLVLLSNLPEFAGSVNYAGGDDTGLNLPNAALKMGWRIRGFKATRCAKPRDDSDPEFNRYVSLIFGDKVYHHGGFTRIATQGDKPVMAEAYGWVWDEILKRGGAEFLLSDEYSYKFKFDREDQVAAEKMNRLFGGKTLVRK